MVSRREYVLGHGAGGVAVHVAALPYLLKVLRSVIFAKERGHLGFGQEAVLRKENGARGACAVSKHIPIRRGSKYEEGLPGARARTESWSIAANSVWEL